MPLSAFNFGFVPSTQADDGYALDALLLTEYAVPMGSVVAGRLLAVLEAQQMEGREKNRNDRLIAINRDAVQKNEGQGRAFESLRYRSAARAARTVRRNM